MKTYDVTKTFGKKLVMALDDSNTSLDAKTSVIFDLCDALSGRNNTKFSKEEAEIELKRRGIQ